MISRSSVTRPLFSFVHANFYGQNTLPQDCLNALVPS